MQAESGNNVRLLIVFHGTNAENRDKTIDNNFSLSYIGRSTGNQGWFGKGIYFARRCFTAFGYNHKQAQMLCALVLVDKFLLVPGPDDSHNPYHGLDVERDSNGVPLYDAHISPSGKELVMFN